MLSIHSITSAILAAGSAVENAATTVNVGSVLMGILSLLVSIFGVGAVKYLLPKLPAMTQQVFDWLHHQAAGVKNAYARGVLDRIIDLTAQKVIMLENTAIEDLKEKAADGQLTKEELIEALKNVKQRAMDEVKAHASAQGIWSIAKALFLNDEAALSKWLGDTVESAVAKLPPSGLQTAKTLTNALPAIVRGEAKQLENVVNSIKLPTVPPTAAL